MSLTEGNPYTSTELAAAERLNARRRKPGEAVVPVPIDHRTQVRLDDHGQPVVRDDDGGAALSNVDAMRTVEVLGLPSHPDPAVLADTLEDLAKLVRAEVPRAIRYAALYAARGWPGQTLGDGTGARSTSTLTSTESAVIGKVNEKTAIGVAIVSGQFDDVDRRLARFLRFLDIAARDTTTTVTDLVAHAQDLDPIPAGTGECLCCGHFCRPGKNPNDRLRSGFCDACRKAYARASAAAGEHGVERSTFMHQRRHLLNDGKVGKCDLCDRPWTAEAVA